MPNTVKLTLRLSKDLKTRLHNLATLQKSTMNGLVQEILTSYANKSENITDLEYGQKYQQIIQRKEANTKAIDQKHEENRLVLEEAIREMEKLTDFQQNKFRIRITNCLKQHKIPMTESEIAYEIEEDPDAVLAVCSHLEKSGTIKQNPFLKFYMT